MITVDFAIVFGYVAGIEEIIADASRKAISTADSEHEEKVEGFSQRPLSRICQSRAEVV